MFLVPRLAWSAVSPESKCTTNNRGGDYCFGISLPINWLGIS